MLAIKKKKNYRILLPPPPQEYSFIKANNLSFIQQIITEYLL